MDVRKQRPVSTRALPLVVPAVLVVALMGFVGMSENVGRWFGDVGRAPWQQAAETGVPAFMWNTPPGFASAPANPDDTTVGHELVRFSSDAGATISLLLDPDAARSGSAQRACLASLEGWASRSDIQGDVVRTPTARIGALVASGVAVDGTAVDGHAVHAVEHCAWLDQGGLLSVRGSSAPADAAGLDAALATFEASVARK